MESGQPQDLFLFMSKSKICDKDDDVVSYHIITYHLLITSWRPVSTISISHHHFNDMMTANSRCTSGGCRNQ